MFEVRFRKTKKGWVWELHDRQRLRAISPQTYSAEKSARRGWKRLAESLGVSVDVNI